MITRNKKSQTGLESFLIIGIALTFFTVVMILLPSLILKTHIIQTVEYVYNYDNTQLYLLTFLSTTYNNIPVYKQISENLQMNSPDISFVKNELDTIITDAECFNLTSTTKTLAETVGCKATKPMKYTAQTKIVLPYKPGKLTDTLKLVIE
jgi:hypothetical protein